MANRHDIEFKTLDGLTLRGWFYSAGPNSPCIIMSHGFSGIIQQHLSNFAEAFLKQGWSSLVYDNRSFGSSDGTPRCQIDPVLQVRDYYDAFDCACLQLEVDSSKIVYWGTSFSGGNVICAAAIDKRVKAVIAQNPFVSGEMQTAGMPDEMLSRLFQNRSAVAAGHPSAAIPVTPASREECEGERKKNSKAVLNSLDAYEYTQLTKQYGGDWRNEITVLSMLNIMAHEPIRFVHRVSPTPLLMVLAETDETVPVSDQKEMFEAAKEPKQLHVVKGETHFGVYHGKGFEDNIKVQIDFLKKHL